MSLRGTLNDLVRKIVLSYVTDEDMVLGHACLHHSIRGWRVHRLNPR